MRTTVTVPDHLLVEAKRVAAERRTSVTRLVEESLRAYLTEARGARGTSRLAALPLHRTARPVRGLDLDDTSALWELE